MGSRRLLVADLDGTLVGDDAALRRFAAWVAASREGNWLAYATGRSRTSLAGLLAGTELPEPDIAITMVGTEIHDRQGRPWPGWGPFTGWDASIVRDVLSRDERLQPQPAAAQTPLKVSYFAPELPRAAVAGIGRRLESAGVPTSIAYSADLYLDVLPAAAGKGAAARTVAHTLGIPPGRVLVFGDSGNDLSLFQQGFLGTLVANALPELRAAVGPHTYWSPLSHADGVLDGIRHWSVAVS